MRCSEIIESVESDDDMFGTPVRLRKDLPYAEKVALQLPPGMPQGTPESEQQVLDAAFDILERDLGLKKAQAVFRDNDFKSDVIHYYDYHGEDLIEDKDISDDDLFGSERSRDYVIVSPEGEILKRLDDVSLGYAIEVAKGAAAQWSEYDGQIELLRVDDIIDGEEEYTEIPFMDNDVSESDESDNDLFGETTLASQVEKLINTKHKVFTRIMGARGQVTGVRGNSLILKTSPRSTTRYSWGGGSEGLDNGRFKLNRDPAKGVWYVDYTDDPWDIEVNTR